MEKEQIIETIDKLVDEGKVDVHRAGPVLACLNNGWHDIRKTVQRYDGRNPGDAFYPVCNSAGTCTVRAYDAPEPYCLLEAATRENISDTILSALKGVSIKSLKKLNKDVVSKDTIDLVQELGLNSKLLATQIGIFKWKEITDVREPWMALAQCIGFNPEKRFPQYSSQIGRIGNQGVYVCSAGNLACELSYRVNINQVPHKVCGYLTTKLP